MPFFNRVRTFDSKIDPPEVDRLIGANEEGQNGDLDLTKDYIAVCDKSDESLTLSGLIGGRIICFVHEFRIDPSPLARIVADRLLYYVLGWAKAKGHHTAMFIVARDNTKMQKFMEDNGAWVENDGLVYKMEIK